MTPSLWHAEGYHTLFRGEQVFLYRAPLNMAFAAPYDQGRWELHDEPLQLPWHEARLTVDQQRDFARTALACYCGWGDLIQLCDFCAGRRAALDWGGHYRVYCRAMGRAEAPEEQFAVDQCLVWYTLWLNTQRRTWERVCVIPPHLVPSPWAEGEFGIWLTSLKPTATSSTFNRRGMLGRREYLALHAQEHGTSPVDPDELAARMRVELRVG